MKTTLKKFIPWIILFVVLSGLAAWYFISNHVTESENTTYDQKISEAETMYESKEYSTAMSDYYSAAESIPSRKEAFAGIVKVLIDKNRLDDALSVLDESAKKVSSQDQSELYATLGDAYFKAGNYDKALETYKKGQGIGISNPELELMVGKVYLKQGKFSEASAQFTEDVFTDNYASEANLLLAYIQSVSDTSTAKSTLESVTPTDTWKTYYDEFSAVLTSLTTDTKFNATKLARIYINNGYPYLAVSILSPLESEMSEYLEGMYFLGRAYLETGDYDNALTELDKAVTLGGMEDSILWSEARAYIFKSDLNNALSCYSKAIEYEEDSPEQELVSEYLDVLIKNNQLLSASEVVQGVLSNTKLAYLYFYGVQINDLLDNSEKVNYYIGKLSKLTLSSDDQKEYLYLSTKALLDQSGDTTTISSQLDTLLALDRYNPKYYLLYGRLKFNQGDATAASDAYKKAIEYDLNDTVTSEATSLLSSID